MAKKASKSQAPRQYPLPEPPSGLGELAQSVQQELANEPPSETLAEVSSENFYQWYPVAIAELAVRAARIDGQPPMTRREVELLYRCCLSARSLGDAIAVAADFCAMLLPRAGALALECYEGRAVFWMDSLRVRASRAALLVDATGLYAYMEFFGWLIAQPLQPQRFMLGHPRRDDAEPFIALLPAPITVSHRRYGFEFDAQLLKSPIRRTPEQLTDFLQRFPGAALAGMPVGATLKHRARSRLVAALSDAGTLPDATVLAAEMGVSTATLRRRLAEAGSSYRELRDECLKEAAEYYLCATEWPIEHVAHRLGFTDGAAFRRAFHRWTGLAPHAWRKQALP